MSSGRLIVIGPVPPPIHGVSVSTTLVLANPVLAERFGSVEHLDTSDRRAGSTIGRWDLTNLTLGLLHTARLARKTHRPRGVVYLPLSQALGPFLRDSLFIHVARARGWTVVAHLRGSEFREAFLERQGMVRRAYVRFTLRRLTSLAVMGESLRGLFDGIIPASRIAVVYNGTPVPTPSEVERDPWMVLFVSNLRSRKGVMESVEAAFRVLQVEPRARFVFVGNWYDGQFERAVRTRAAAAPPGAVEFRPAVTGPEKDAVMASAAVFLFPPTEPEGHPRVVLEAMAAGLPVVTTDQGAIRDTVVDGDTGFVLPEADPERIAECVIALLQDPERRERMSAAARERWAAHFSQPRADVVLADWLSDVAQGRETAIV